MTRAWQHACLVASRCRPQDIFSLFHLDRPFKFVSKTSNFYIPIVGWSMFLTGDRIFHPVLRNASCALNRCGLFSRAWPLS